MTMLAETSTWCMHFISGLTFLLCHFLYRDLQRKEYANKFNAFEPNHNI